LPDPLGDDDEAAAIPLELEREDRRGKIGSVCKTGLDSDERELDGGMARRLRVE
jgi:hypothetical protein